MALTGQESPKTPSRRRSGGTPNVRITRQRIEQTPDREAARLGQILAQNSR
jgi:hypothetical protein